MTGEPTHRGRLRTIPWRSRAVPAALALAAGVLILWADLELAGSRTIWQVTLGWPGSVVPGAVFGLAALAAGAFLLVTSRATIVLGGVVMVAGAASVPWALGGYVLGFGCAEVGGAIAIVLALGDGRLSNGRSSPWS